MKEFFYKAEGINTSIPVRSFKEVHGVTLCCIILNEEKEIQDFLEYHRPYFKEILMIDLGSVDRTIELATPLVSSITLYKQDGHHSNALNRIIEKVKTNWTCLLDCDERLEKGILEKISSLINQEEYDCYEFPRNNIIDGNPDPERPIDYQERLFRSYCRMIRPVHQELVGYKKKKTMPELPGNYIVHSKELIRHKSRNMGYAVYEHKFQNEIGGPGSQMEESFYKAFPGLDWNILSKSLVMR